MIDLDENAPGRVVTGPEASNPTNCSNPTPAPAEAQVLIPDFNIDVHGFILMAAEIKEQERQREKSRCEFMDRQRQRVRDGIAEVIAELEKHRMKHLSEVAKMKHRQEVADRLAEAQLELTLLEIEIRRAELAAMKEGGPNP